MLDHKVEKVHKLGLLGGGVAHSGFVLLEGLVSLLILAVISLVFVHVHSYVSRCQQDIMVQVGGGCLLRSFIEREYAGLEDGNVMHRDDRVQIEPLEGLRPTITKDEREQASRLPLLKIVRLTVSPGADKEATTPLWLFAVVPW